MTADWGTAAAESDLIDAALRRFWEQGMGLGQSQQNLQRIRGVWLERDTIQQAFARFSEEVRPRV